VLLAEGDPLSEELRQVGVRPVVVASNDLGMRANAALVEATHDKVVITDSDCVMREGCIEAMSEALDRSSVVRARMEFRHSGRFWAKAIAGWREYENNHEPVPAFQPGLGIHRRLLKDLAPPLFPESVLFSEDDAFDSRVKQHRIPVRFLSEAVVSHDVIGFRHFLNSGTRTGAGTARQVFLGVRPHYERPLWLAASLFRFRWLREFRSWAAGAGFSAALVAALWYLAYYSGYFSERRAIRRRGGL
jgi:hypothetical protein